MGEPATNIYEGVYIKFCQKVFWINNDNHSTEPQIPILSLANRMFLIFIM